MDAVSSQAKREQQLPSLDSLDPAALKEIVLSQQTEIENLKLLVLKLKRMHFGPRSEKLNADIEQLELQLEDLEANQAAAEPFAPATAHGFSRSGEGLRANPRVARFPPNWRARPRS